MKVQAIRRESSEILHDISTWSPSIPGVQGVDLSHRWMMEQEAGRCPMQAVTLQECVTFFSSIAVILYLWMQ
jgi:hypothetical protein